MGKINNRILSAIVKENMMGLWNAGIESKKDQLTILSNQHQQLIAEAQGLKDRLFNLGATVPEESSSKDFTKASNLPIAFVGDNLNTMEGMVQYSQGQVDSLQAALNEFNQGAALMEELGDTYAGLDAVDQYGPDAYKNFMVEGSIGDTITTVSEPQEGYTEEGQYFHLRGGRVTEEPGSEMAQLFANLTPEQKALYNKPGSHFKQGFMYGNTKESAINKQLLSLEVENQLMAHRQAKDSAINEDFENLQNVLNISMSKYGSAVKSSITLGGQHPDLLNAALVAGDDNYQSSVNSFLKNYKFIGDDMLTMINAFRNQDGNMYPVISVVSGMYDEYETMTSISEHWKNTFPDQAKEFHENAISAKFEAFPSDMQKDAKTFYNAYHRYNEFNSAGMWPNEEDMKIALRLNEAQDEITMKQLNYLANQTSESVDEMYNKGMDIFTDDMISLISSDDYQPKGDLKSQIDDIEDWDLATEAYIASQGGGNDYNIVQREIEVANQRAKVKDVKGKLKILKDNNFSHTAPYYELIDSLKGLNQELLIDEGMLEFYAEKQEQLDATNNNITTISNLLGMSEEEAKMILNERNERMKTQYRSVSDRSTYPGQYQK